MIANLVQNRAQGFLRVQAISVSVASAFYRAIAFYRYVNRQLRSLSIARSRRLSENCNDWAAESCAQSNDAVIMAITSMYRS